MAVKPSILLINLAHYGRHTDGYKHCQYLNKYYHITYLCFKQNEKKIKDETNVIYLNRTSNTTTDIFKIIKISRELIKNNDYKLIYITYFKLSSLIKLFINKTFLLDIRTGSVNEKKFNRWKYNFLLKIESKFFKNITIISESLREKLKLNNTKCTIIPLGADILSSKKKIFTDLKLFYIGSLQDRNIHQTVNGLAKFIKENKNININITYDIIGADDPIDEEILKQSINNNNLEHIVSHHGRKSHDEAQKYFDNCNIGISYIPMTEYYDCQPPTKTFEYINSGMICLGTNTRENKLLINSKNGLLFDDNEDAFKEALVKITNNMKNYKTNEIINSLNEYTWKNIINNKLYPLLKEIIAGKNKDYCAHRNN